MRVNALALVHRILHEIEDVDSVDVQRLLTDLAHQIQEGLGAERGDPRLEVDVAARRISGDLAVPIALFTVEALTNAYKHAFAPGAHGAIRIALAPVGEDKLKLTIEDSGAGLADNLLQGGTGARLIKAFTQQVRGTLGDLAARGRRNGDLARLPRSAGPGGARGNRQAGRQEQRALDRLQRHRIEPRRQQFDANIPAGARRRGARGQRHFERFAIGSPALDAHIGARREDAGDQRRKPRLAVHRQRSIRAVGHRRRRRPRQCPCH